ncbi:hypothetical protein XHV734_2654 [Xanthomonas hortorum pv. vitians]|nr:hypothetical protein XHV734_2654 [Xanthomonas hortorum pv. vitians]
MPFRSHSNTVPRRQRGRGLAESGTWMCRGGESDRMSDRAEEPIPGRAVAPAGAELTGGAQHWMRYGCGNNIGQPYPHPNPSPDGRGASGNVVVTALSTFRSRGNKVPRR